MVYVTVIAASPAALCLRLPRRLRGLCGRPSVVSVVPPPSSSSPQAAARSDRPRKRRGAWRSSGGESRSGPPRRRSGCVRSTPGGADRSRGVVARRRFPEFERSNGWRPACFPPLAASGRRWHLTPASWTVDRPWISGGSIQSRRRNIVRAQRNVQTRWSDVHAIDTFDWSDRPPLRLDVGPIAQG